METGRYAGLSVQDRLCNICNLNETEDEIHFLFKCPCYDDLRQTLINKACETETNFMSLNDFEKLRYVVERHYVYLAKFLVSVMYRRKSLLYK